MLVCGATKFSFSIKQAVQNIYVQAAQYPGGQAKCISKEEKRTYLVPI
jgi:hypothetical protein